MPPAVRGSVCSSARSPDLLASVFALQRSAGNRATSRVLARSGVETDVVSPAVRGLLDENNIKYAREVTFVLLDADGKPLLKGRFDLAFRHPVTQELIFPELKGDKLWALTSAQEIYVPLFESDTGAQVRITSRLGGSLYLPPGTVEHVRSGNFFRIGSANINEFTAFIKEAATGKRPTHFYYKRGKLLAFNSKQELHAELSKPETGMVVEKPAAKPTTAVGGEKPLKPPDPHATPPPNPLHDPPARKPPPAPSRADPLAGPPASPGRSGPHHKPQPADYGLGKPTRTPPTGPTEPTPSSGPGSPAFADAEAAAERAAGSLAKAEGRMTRVVYKMGAIAEAMLPGPLDALMLMVDYAGAWASAKEEALRLSFQHGFRLGLAAGLIGLEKPWVDGHLRRRFVEKDVISELIGVTGLRELETNKGLDLGLQVGAAFPAAERGELLDAGFLELAKEGVRIADKREIFTIETVAKLSRVLRPWSDAVFDEVATFVGSIGDSRDDHMIAGGPEPRTQHTTTRTRAVWFNVAPGIRRLELLREGSVSIDAEKTSDLYHLEDIPGRVAAMAIRRTEQRFGKVEEIDGPLMPPRRMPIAAKERRQPIAAGR